ncbi:MAG: fatty acid--CoA ligase [Gammaproteobacteria bacterium]
MMEGLQDVKTLGEWLELDGMTQNDEIAIEFEGEQISYRELTRRARAVANGLIAMGIRADDRVAIFLKNSPEYVELLLGCSIIGAAPVGVNWRLAPPEVAYVINDSQAKVLFCGSDFADLIQGIRADLKQVTEVFATGFERAEWPYYTEWRDRQDASLPNLKSKPEDTALQLYTSGTTGHPKGACLTHANFLYISSNLEKNEWFDWTSQEVNLVCMPMFHIAGTNWILLGLLAGCRNIILRDVDPGAILELIEESRVTTAIFVPAVIMFLMQHPRCAETDFSSFRQLTYGASPIPEELLKQAMARFECDFVQVYGLTETCGLTTNMRPEAHRQGGSRLRSCGTANTTVEVQVQDDEGKEVPHGEIGEIVTRSPAVMSGYWNLPEETAKAFRNGWFRTGDAGYRDEEGYFYIHDRIKDMIISGGENIYPAEIESALFAHPEIADVAVFGIPDEKWGEAVHTVIVMKPDTAPISLEDLQTYARAQLAGYKIPRSMETIDVLPRNPSGKILRRLLREKYWQGTQRQVN